MPSSKRAALRALTGAAIRKAFLDFFAERGHTIVPSMSLVPGGDQTLLFTNSGMVQFKDVFLGTGTRAYRRVADSQKCMRVAGKHNDLDDVGRDNSHHTFFEMLGNWSFGDYYKKEAIGWAWELLTDVWGIDPALLWATCFEDERGQVPRDDEAADFWRQQPGFHPDHLLFFGRKDNFWEMAETGPCGPDSEIHIDRGPQFCDKQGVPGHVCQVNGDCPRFLELWNLVFIQYNRSSPTSLEPLPSKHVDTGMGFERIVSVLQDVDSNYKTDLFMPLMDTVQRLAGHTDAQRAELLTPYRVIADHARAASFLIADGVVPGNTGRNYVCRMIIRRASRFGAKAGFDEPFLAQVAETVLKEYGEVYPELERNRQAILRTLTDEERRFQRTVDTGVTYLGSMLDGLRQSATQTLDGARAFDLYATYGLPLEITRDIARESGMQVDEDGFREAMESHRQASGAGQAMGELVEQDVEVYQGLLARLRSAGRLPAQGVRYDPYGGLESEGPVLALVKSGREVECAEVGDDVALVLPETHFYVESGGQVADGGTIVSVSEPRWEFAVREARQPITGLVVHMGRVLRGQPRRGDAALASVDASRRRDIMRNHTATHLLHASLRAVLGEHARQAGSLVAPDRLRFDFTHTQAMTKGELERVQAMVHQAILADYELDIHERPRDEAIREGAMALFGETYGETVRTITIGEKRRFSFELCGGTHVDKTGVIGPFLILSEGSVAAGVRRIEAVTGRAALALIQDERNMVTRLAERLGTASDSLDSRVDALLDERDQLARQLAQMHGRQAADHFAGLQPIEVRGIPVLAGHVPDASAEMLRELVDRFRGQHPSGVIVLGSAPDGKPVLVAGVSQDLVGRGLNAAELVKTAARPMGGGGGGKPTLAQAGGKDASRLSEALAAVAPWVESHLR
jgi:alanyl-tRNA synthetase